MEQNIQYLMWMNSKQLVMKSNLQLPASMASFNSPSWEEKAFAEDIAAGPLGGFVWPPRSYSCTFCGREFRSAQALGGHMNVHRRDRARLKQSLCSHEAPSSPSATDPDHQGNHSGASNYSNTATLFAASSSCTNNSRASASASAVVVSQENSSEEAYVSSFSSNNMQGRSSSSPDHSNSVRLFSSTPSCCKNDHEDAVETTLSVGINYFRNDEMTISNSKRLKSSASFPFFHKSCSSNRSFPFQYSSTTDDIDLELRLGDAPAVK